MRDQRSPTRNNDTAGASATKLLAEDHEAVRQMKARYEAPDLGSAARRDLAHEVFLALEVHASVEEKLFYPAVAKAVGRDGQRLVKEAIEEHKAVKNAIAALRTLALGDTAFDPRFLAMLADVEHHASEEEREMFPRADEALGGEVVALGSRITMLKNTLLRAKVTAGAA